MKKPALFHVKHWLSLALLLPVFAFGQHFSTSSIQLKPMPNLPAKNASIEEYLQQFPSYSSLPAEMKDWYYWTNYSRRHPKSFYDSIVVPVLKTFPNLQTAYAASLKRDLYAAGQLCFVSPSTTLANVAQSHADDLKAAKSKLSHNSPSGLSFQDRMSNANVKNCAGENLSYGPINTVLALVFLYIDEKIPDLGHRKSLLNPVYSQMGVGISVYPDGNHMIVQDFSCEQ